MQKSLKTQNGNFLSNQENKFAYFSENGIFLKWSDVQEYNWALETWNVSETETNFIFPVNDIQFQYSSNDFFTEFFAEKNIYIDGLTYLEPSKFILDISTINLGYFEENNLKKFKNEIWYTEHRSHTDYKYKCVSIFEFCMNNTIYNLISQWTEENDRYGRGDDIVIGYYTIIKGNLMDQIEDIEVETKSFKMVMAEKLLSNIE